MQSYTRVAVIGPEDSIASCIDVARVYTPQLELVPFPYELEDEAPDLFKSLADTYSLVLFTGPIPYYRTKETVDTGHASCVYIPFNGVALYRALFQIRHLRDFSRVSIDTIAQNEVSAAYRELGLPESSGHVLEYNRALTAAELVSFHAERYVGGLTDVALTCLRSAHLELVRRGIPSVRIFPVASAIRETLDRIRLIGESEWRKGHQICVGILSVDGYDEWARRKGMYETQKLHLQLGQSMFNYVRSLDGHFINTSPGEFLFFTTRAMVESSTEQFTKSPSLLESVYLPPDLTLSMGLGIGETANLAADHARTALQRAKDFGFNSCFIVNEDHQIIGPLGQHGSVAEDLRVTNDLFLDIARKTGLGAVTVSRLMNAIHNLGKDFTANELASFLGITVRSTRRLLNQLEEAQVLTVVGQEAPYARGKPRRVFRLR